MLRRALIENDSRKLRNGRWQVRKLHGLWVTIDPYGYPVIYYDSPAYRDSPWRRAMIVAMFYGGRPF